MGGGYLVDHLNFFQLCVCVFENDHNTKLGAKSSGELV